MRTSGPLLPSGRRSASISSGGSAVGICSSRRISATTRLGAADASWSVDALARFVHEEHVGVGAVAQFVSAEAAHADDREPGRQSVAPAVPHDRAQRARERRRVQIGQCAADPVHQRPVVGLGRLVLGAVGADRGPPAAVRNSSRRRTPRATATACCAVSARGRRRRGSPAPAGRGRAARGRSGSPSSATASGARISRSGAKRPADSTRARFSAAAPSSRSSRRYHGVLPSASDTLRKPSSPASGSAESANQPSSTGSSVRWIAALRLTPDASASRCRSAAAGSAYPSASSRCLAAFGLSRVSPRRELRDRVEQRPVEELLVQPADHRGVASPGPVQLGDRVAPQPEGAAEAAQVGVVLRHQVGAP